MSANRNLAIRVATAAVGAPAILALLYWGAPWGFFCLTLLCSLLAALELFGMTHPGDGPSRLFGVGLTGAVAATVFFFTGRDGDPRAVMTVLTVVPAMAPLFTLVRLGDLSTAALRSCAFGFGPLYVGVPLTLLAVMRRDLGDAGPGFVVISIMFAWFSDTGGYFAGRFLGKHPLYPAVSPKKTVEGSIGGIAGALFGAVLASLWFLPSLPLVHSLPLAVVASATGQAGDLAESLLKRSTGVKDSGQIVPGHGGMLDRIDALLLTSVIVYLYTVWVRA